MYKKDLDLERNWGALLKFIGELVGKQPKDLNGVLFLIGVQELGQGHRFFTKEEKQDLMHLGICKIMSYAGYYQLIGQDTDGWPHWKTTEKIPHFDVIEQEKLLKMQAMEYFEKEFAWTPGQS